MTTLTKTLTMTFKELNLSEAILKATEDMGFTQASSIQAEAIPQILKGTDIIAKAPTGSGKTAAFAIPILEKLDLNPENKSVQAVILCPTRELTIQVQKEFEKLTKYQDHINVVSVYGGQQIDRQLTALKKKPQIVVATPGRLMDHLKRGSVNLNAISMVVLDEADEMLDMGFRDDINTILEGTPENKQTVLFSATMAKEIMALTKRFQKNPTVVDVTGQKQHAPDIKQVYFEVVEKDKPELITRLLNLHNVKLALVFCNTKSSVDMLVEVLKTRGYLADSLHGDMNQTQREKVMNGFRKGSVQILVATDVAGRGIDVKDIQAVFNYDLPRDDEDYIHRIGRTARAGTSGTAFSFVSKRQLQSLKRIERANGSLIHKHETPTIEQLDIARFNTYSLKIKSSIEKDDLSTFHKRLNDITDEVTSIEDVAAALFKIVLDQECKKIDNSAVFSKDDYNDDIRDNRRSGRPSRFNDRGPRRKEYSGRSSSRSNDSYRSKRNDDNENGRSARKSEKIGTLDDMISAVRSLSEPVKKNYDDKPNFKKFDRAPRKSSSRKPEYSNDGETSKATRDFSDKPKRDYKPRANKDFSDKPKRDYKPRANKDFSDKPKATKDFSDKPKKSYGKKSSDFSKGKITGFKSNKPKK